MKPGSRRISLGRRRAAAAAAGIVVLAGVAAGPAAGASRPAHVRATLTFEVVADGVSTTPVNTYLRVDAPADRKEVVQILANSPGTPGYRAALVDLLRSLGLFAGQPLSQRLALNSDAPPDVSVADGRAVLVFTGSRDLAFYLTYGIPGLWQAAREGQDRVRFSLPTAAVGTDVDWTVEAYVSGAQVISATPRPEEWLRAGGFPAVPDAQTEPKQPPRATGRSGIDYLAWRAAPAAGSPPATAGAGEQGQLAFEVRLAGRTRVLIASYDGRWGHLRLALSYLVAGLVLVPLLYLLLALPAAGPEGVGRGRVWAALAGSAILITGGVLMWLLHPAATGGDVSQVRPPLIAGALAFGVALVPHRRSRTVVLVLLGLAAAVTVAAFWAQGRAGREAYSSGGWTVLVEGAVAAAAMALLTLAAIGALAGALAGAVSGRTTVPRSSRIGLIVLAGGGLLVFQSASATYHGWQRRHDVAAALLPGLVPTGWQSWAAGALVYFPLSFVGLVMDLLPLVAFAALAAVLTPLSKRATSTLFDRPEPLLTAFVLIFAAFVPGTQGSLYGWSVPLGFMVALVLRSVLRRRPIEQVVGAVDALNPGLERPAAITARAELLRRATEGKNGIALPEGVSAGGLALSLGPGRNWWDSGRIALRLGALLSLAPLGFYAYVLASKRLVHDLSLKTDGGIADLLRSSVHEVLFWLVAAFVLGVLFPYLPSSAGAVKGAALALVYAVATGLAMWILPGGGDWLFRCVEVSLFLVVLGVLLDWKTLTEHGAPWRYLLDHYHVADLRFSSVYASTAIGALAVIVQQLHSGDAQGAITQIIKSLPSLIPPAIGGH